MKMKLSILPEGEVEPWEFEFVTGSYCGKANDSVGIHFPGHGSDGRKRSFGCALTREDVTKLRAFLQEAERNWNPTPPSFESVIKQMTKSL